MNYELSRDWVVSLHLRVACRLNCNTPPATSVGGESESNGKKKSSATSYRFEFDFRRIETRKSSANVEQTHCMAQTFSKFEQFGSKTNRFAVRRRIFTRSSDVKTENFCNFCQFFNLNF